MSINQDFKDLLRLLNQEGAEFLVVGAYAVIYYTEPRYTKDIDLWVNPEKNNAEKVFAALKKFGAPLKKITADDFANKELFYQIGVEPNRIDIIMDISGLEFTKAWKKRKRTHYGEENISMLSLADLIKAKKSAGRPQDLLDLQKLARVKTKSKSLKP